MSYILDALKRADSERSRGQVPGLHAQPMGPLNLSTDEPANRWTVPALVLVLVAVLAGLVWWWSASGEPAPPMTASSAVGAPAMTTAPAPPMPVSVPPPVVVAVAPPAPISPTLPSTSAPVRAAVAPANPSARAATERRPPARPAQGTPATTATSPGAAGPSTAAAQMPVADASAVAVGEPSRIYTRQELPEEIRSLLPTLTVGGASHSDKPANRMLILNGQLYHEGDRITSELTLQQIQLRSAVLVIRGYRFGISY